MARKYVLLSLLNKTANHLWEPNCSSVLCCCYICCFCLASYGISSRSCRRQAGNGCPCVALASSFALIYRPHRSCAHVSFAVCQVKNLVLKSVLDFDLIVLQNFRGARAFHGLLLSPDGPVQLCTVFPQNFIEFCKVRFLFRVTG